MGLNGFDPFCFALFCLFVASRLSTREPADSLHSPLVCTASPHTDCDALFQGLTLSPVLVSFTSICCFLFICQLVIFAIIDTLPSVCYFPFPNTSNETSNLYPTFD